MTDVDFTIIGAGAAGLLLADRLSQSAPDAKIIILEAESQAGYHASGRSAAIFVPSYGHGFLRELTVMSRPYFESADPEFFPSPLFNKRGILRLVLQGGEEQYFDIIKGMSGIEPLSPQQAVDLFPMIDPTKIVAASLEPDAPEIDTHLLLQGATKRAEAGGVEFSFGSKVTKLKSDGDSWKVETEAQGFHSKVVINAAGSWANEIAGIAGLAPLNMVPCRRSFATLPMPDALAENTDFPFTVTSPLRWYAKPDGGRLLISPAEEDEVTPYDAMADDMVIAEGLQRFNEDTGFEPSRVEHTMAGIRMITPDEYPAIGFDNSAEGFFWLAGQCGFGIQCAPGLAMLASQLLIASDHLDHRLIDAFDANRLRHL